jgi:hypothetical protein
LSTIAGKYLDQRLPVVRVRFSNAVAGFEGDEFHPAPAVQKHLDMWALVDTGATKSVIDVEAQRDLGLPQQGSAPVLFPNMACTEFHPTYTSAMSLFEHYSAGSRLRDWPDWLEVLAFSLEGRPYGAVIGMDVLSQIELKLVKGQPLFDI